MSSLVLPRSAQVIAFAIGILTHLGVFIRGEWHLQAPQLVVIHLALVILPWLARILIIPTQAYAIPWDILACFSSYLIGLFGSISIYRLFFHRLRSFPGPRLAAWTKLWHAYQCRDSRNYLVLDSLHRQYGPFVRTGPEEITIFHPGAIELLDGANNHNERSEFGDLLHPRVSTLFSRNEREHIARRRVWTMALSTKSINEYLPRIRKQISILENVIDQSAGHSVVLNDLMSFFAFDMMGDFVFNQSYGMMESSLWHQAVLKQKAAVALVGTFQFTVWLIRIGLVFAPFSPMVKDWQAMITHCDNRMNERLKSQVTSPDIAHWFIDEYEKGAETMDPEERRNLLSGNAISAIVGGSDTTATTLTLNFAMLARYPGHAKRIFDEIVQLKDLDNVSDLASLSHLNAFINETMRLYPTAMTGSSRITSAEGATIDGTFIPGNVQIAAPKYTIFRLESAFEQPLEFIPERWYSRPELIKDSRAFAPFGVGRRNCVGKNLALSQVRLVIASLLRRFQIRPAPGSDLEALERDMRDQVTAHPGLCHVIFEPRKELGSA